MIIFRKISNHTSVSFSSRVAILYREMFLWFDIYWKLLSIDKQSMIRSNADDYLELTRISFIPGIGWHMSQLLWFFTSKHVLCLFINRSTNIEVEVFHSQQNQIIFLSYSMRIGERFKWRPTCQQRKFKFTLLKSAYNVYLLLSSPSLK